MPVPRLIPGYTAILVVDVQERLLPAMHNAAQVAEQAGRLLDGAAVAGVPAVVTEQYPKGLGPTVPELAARLSAAPRHEKTKFSALVESVRDDLVRLQARSVLVCGIEAHVCVLQTCLDLIDHGYVTALATDAIGSRRAADHQAAVQRLVQAGVIPTTVESALLELLREASGERFKAMLKVIK